MLWRAEAFESAPGVSINLLESGTILNPPAAWTAPDEACPHGKPLLKGSQNARGESVRLSGGGQGIAEFITGERENMTKLRL
ncbi:MAG: hypothetical protein O7A08_05455, partial [SAR324 cluster bacterium]|nr:hypothetical protein [SAR324 cluster bacterium]